MLYLLNSLISLFRTHVLSAMRTQLNTTGDFVIRDLRSDDMFMFRVMKELPWLTVPIEYGNL